MSSGQTTTVEGRVAATDSTETQPVFWQHENTAFVANLLGLFFGNEEETQMLADIVGEVDSYGGRLAPVLDLLFQGPGENLLVLEREPDADLLRHFRDKAGLSIPKIIVLPHRDYLEIGERLRKKKTVGDDRVAHVFEEFARHPSTRVDGYVTDDILTRLAKASGRRTFSSIEGSRRGNNKWLLHRHLDASGAPVPATEEAESTGEIRGCLAKLERGGFSAAVIKAPLGASGIGMVKVYSLADCDELAASVPTHFFTEGPCLVQGWLQPGQFGIATMRSPSVQLFLNEDEVTMYDITEQILSSDSVHEGNESPPPYLDGNPEWRAELLRQAAVAGSWLHEQGYRGTASADFLLAEKDNGDFEVYVCELNARVTGATYPSVLARHFMPGGAWLMQNLRFSTPLTGRELLDKLEESGDLYVPGTSESGVFPLNFNFGPDGLVHKGQFLYLAPSSDKSRLLLDFANLDLPCKPARD